MSSINHLSDAYAEQYVNPSINRLVYLDAVRAFALLLGVIFHASLSFSPMFLGWAVMDINTSNWVLMFLLISHSFRMELFFLLAGFFTHMVWLKKGAKHLLKTRFTRIVLPFVIGWFVLYPLIVASWTIGAQSMQGEANILHGITTSYSLAIVNPHNIFTGTHLWFLYYLLIITACMLLIVHLVKLSKACQRNMANTSKILLAWCTHSHFGLFFLACLTAVIMWFMDDWNVETPDKTLTLNTPVFLLYFGCFALGWGLFHQQQAFDSLQSITKSKIFFCLIAIVGCVIMSGYQMQAAHPDYIYIKAGYLLCYGMMMWTLVSLSLGLGNRFLSKENNIIRYLADSSYWLYLTHLPIVLALQIALAELDLYWLMKLSIICAITVVLCLLSYDGFVRSTVIGKTLNGSKKPRVIFKSKHVM